MKLFAAILSARFWLTLMMSFTMGMSTAAADIHPSDPHEAACQETQIASAHGAESALIFNITDGEEKDDHEREHNHHAHHCGTCHMHVVIMRLGSMSLVIAGEQALSMGADQPAASAGPFGLYRPPRA